MLIHPIKTTKRFYYAFNVFYHRNRERVAWLLIIFNIITWAVAYNVGNDFYNHYVNLIEPLIAVRAAEVDVKSTSALPVVEEQTGTKAWALKKWSDRFGAKVAWQLEVIMGTKESGWNANAYHCNTNGTVDLSWYQINSVHVENGKLSLECAASPICSTEFAMDLYEEQSWCPWYGAKALGFCQ